MSVPNLGGGGKRTVSVPNGGVVKACVSTQFGGGVVVKDLCQYPIWGDGKRPVSVPNLGGW